MSRHVFRLGDVFGRLTVIGPGPFVKEKNGKRRRTLKCLCACGVLTFVRHSSLISGNTTSCGCFHKEIAAENARTLGLRHGRYGTPEYKAWQSMKNRCYLTTHDSYKNYGGRGITVCDRWRSSFEAFFEDMGVKPGPGYSLDRIDPNKPYEPGNCRWATSKQQMNNRRANKMIAFDGKTLTLQEWAERTGINRSTISSRIKHGWPLKLALTAGR